MGYRARMAIRDDRSMAEVMVTSVDVATSELPRRAPDRLAVEAPLTIQLETAAGTTTVSTTMRTPGHDFELAAGFCHNEGMLAGARVADVRYCTDQGPASGAHVVTVTALGAPAPVPRLGTTTSSCGLCGTEAIDAVTDRLVPLPDPLELGPELLELLATIPDRVRPYQRLFDDTGAVHAAASFTLDGEIGLVREDVGRHNAVDKVVGRLLLDGTLPATGQGLFVSGRASFELVYKAWAAGFAVLVAVSAPTELAVRTARRGGLALVGFVRGTALNVYAPDSA